MDLVMGYLMEMDEVDSFSDQNFSDNWEHEIQRGQGRHAEQLRMRYIVALEPIGQVPHSLAIPSCPRDRYDLVPSLHQA